MREYNVATGGVTVANASVTLVAIRAAAAPSVNLECLRWWIGQSANATSAQQRVILATKGTAFSTLGALTPAQLKLQDTASVIVGSTTEAAGTAGVNASAEGAGAYVIISQDAFNVLNGWLMVPTPPETIIAPASHGSALIMQFPVAPATLTSWSFGLQYREV